MKRKGLFIVVICTILLLLIVLFLYAKERDEEKARKTINRYCESICVNDYAQFDSFMSERAILEVMGSNAIYGDVSTQIEENWKTRDCRISVSEIDEVQYYYINKKCFALIFFSCIVNGEEGTFSMEIALKREQGEYLVTSAIVGGDSEIVEEVKGMFGVN